MPLHQKSGHPSQRMQWAKRNVTEAKQRLEKRERLTISWARGLTPVRRHWAITRRWSWSTCSCSNPCCAATIAGIEPASGPKPATARSPAAGLKGTSSIAPPGGWAWGCRLRRCPLRRRGRRKSAPEVGLGFGGRPRGPKRRREGDGGRERDEMERVWGGKSQPLFRFLLFWLISGLIAMTERWGHDVSVYLLEMLLVNARDQISQLILIAVDEMQRVWACLDHL